MAQQKGSYQNMFKTSLVNHRHSFQHSFLIKKLPKLLGLCFGFFFFLREQVGSKTLGFFLRILRSREQPEVSWTQSRWPLIAVITWWWLQQQIYLFSETTLHLVLVSETNPEHDQSSYLRDRDGSGQQSWGHPPTRISRAPCGQAAGPGATRSARRPWGSGWSCSGWDPPPSPGTGWGQMLGPATRSASI